MSRSSDLESSIFNFLQHGYYYEPLRPYRFSGSQMPICPRAVALSDSKLFARKQTSRSESILSTGVRNHAIIQKWLANSGILFGKFKSNNGKIYPFPQHTILSDEEEKEYAHKGKLSPKYDCDKYNWVGTSGPLYNSDNTPMEYLEWRVYDKLCGFTGLIDAVFKLNGWDKYAICDFKFVGESSFLRFRANGVDECAPYRYQLNSYRYNIENKILNKSNKPIPLYDTCYLIIMRDNFITQPSLSNILVIPIKYEPDMYLEQRDLFIKVNKKINSKNVKYFCSSSSALCKSDSDCNFCPGKYICFGRNPKKEIRKLLTLKWEL